MAQDIAVPLEFEEVALPRVSALRRALKLARRHPLGVFGLLVIGVLLFAGIFAELAAPYDPLAPNRISKTFAELSEPVDAQTTEFTVNDSSDLGFGQTVGIESEQIIVLLIVGNTVTVDRGAERSSAPASP